MKKSLLFIFLLLSLSIAINGVFAQSNLYQQDSLHLELDIKGRFELIPKSGAAMVREAKAVLQLYPQESFRQEILEMQNSGTVEDNNVLYKWKNPSSGMHEFGYTALVKTNNQRTEVRKKISFPLDDIDIQGIEEYTYPTEKIDSNNPEIIARAAELAEGEDDLFKVAFKLANWVSENVEYKLNELTTEIAQPASWVLDNRQGVCDEMTSLFVAMARSLGIPARFVSGISYTEDPDVIRATGSNWASHGWAEVYFPEIGWVSFDITFDEYGYVDVTHIKLRESLDPDEPATGYEWLAENVDMKTFPLSLNAKVMMEGSYVPEEILLEQEILAPEVDYGSYNQVKGILKNTADYYVATTLRLAAPKEISVVGDNKRTILLAPREVKETFWTIKVDGNLNENFEYKFPLIIYSEKNASVEDIFSARKGEASYSFDEVNALAVKDEDKSYSRKVTLRCAYPEKIKVDEDMTVKCTIRNIGDINLEKINFCLEEICRSVDLPIGGEKEIDKKMKAKKAGWNKIKVSAVNNLIEKRESFTYSVRDAPKIKTIITAPAEVDYGENMLLSITLNKESFDMPKSVIVVLKGSGFENRWEIDELQKEQKIEMLIENLRVGNKNRFTIITSWKDEENRSYHKEEELIVRGKAGNIKERIGLLLNSFLNFFV